MAGAGTAAVPDGVAGPRPMDVSVGAPGSARQLGSEARLPVKLFDIKAAAVRAHPPGSFLVTAQLMQVP